MTASHYEERSPVRALEGVVECVWTQTTSAGDAAYPQRIVPDGCVDAMWLDGRLCVAGPDTGWRMGQLPPGVTNVGVRFRPGAAPLLFGAVPVSELLDQQVELADLWGARVARRLAARTGDAASAASVLQEAVVARLPHVGEPDPVVRSAVRALHRPRASVVAVADRFGLSERQLRRRFTATVGYGPKALAGVLRLRRAMALCARPGAVPADVAAEAGYADQPHLTREMRRLAGVTPGELA
jgi:AraC-like DNA-binding protein